MDNKHRCQKRKEYTQFVPLKTKIKNALKAGEDLDSIAKEHIGFALSSNKDICPIIEEIILAGVDSQDESMQSIAELPNSVEDWVQGLYGSQYNKTYDPKNFLVQGYAMYVLFKQVKGEKRKIGFGYESGVNDHYVGISYIQEVGEKTYDGFIIKKREANIATIEFSTAADYLGMHEIPDLKKYQEVLGVQDCIDRFEDEPLPPFGTQVSEEELLAFRGSEFDNSFNSYHWDITAEQIFQRVYEFQERC